MDRFPTVKGHAPGTPVDVRIGASDGSHDARVAVKLYFAGQCAPLSDCLPILERFGLKVADHRSTPWAGQGEGPASAHEFVLAGESLSALKHGHERIEEAIRSIWRNDFESDDFCRVVAAAGLDWREVTVLVAYRRYLRQIGFPLGTGEIAAALCRNPEATVALIRLFETMFDPDLPEQRDERMARQRAAVLEAMMRVASAEDDRILRKYLMLIQATVRTNFFQRQPDGTPKDYLSFKLSSREVEGLPLPCPLFEIFVYSPRVEGIHLRGGKVARGGIRWSDRHADYRTEIHGLLKAQMVKNVVIVPEGSKGGFVVRRPPADMLLREEGIACYRTFIRGLLDLTDNIVGDTVVGPARTVRRDADDPYLVVAADKGTATFSDLANAVADEYGFWLGDAFASGGSAGYDHKKMAITARGAWESVRRHFREMDIDVQSQEFTVAGVGDMSGDVFGNGMLLSPKIRLVGAFDHRHIFLDPNADTVRGYEERNRLFHLQQSSWADYPPSALGDGGGVFERSARCITVSEAARKMLDLTSVETTPNAVISALLKAPVDLLWLGGIGTYVKASGETHDQVGDRASDAVRVDADKLRCRVIGEGANLGLTQRARIQYALGGGRINTDAIDNAGGVDCSDHEVNIKILLAAAMRSGKLSLAQRNDLLSDMTDEVAQLVLRDNYLQSQALSVALANAPQMLATHQRLMQSLERCGYLDRRVAVLPDDEELKARFTAGQGLTRPELAVLLAYTKISIYAEVIRSDLPDDPLFSRDLAQYFPSQLRTKFVAEIAAHPLRREIVATMVVNGMVNRVGSGFVNDLQEVTGCSDDAAVRAYAVVRNIFGLQQYWEAVEDLDGKVACATQVELLLEARRLVESATLWMLRHVSAPIDVSKVVFRFAGAVHAIRESLPQLLSGHQEAEHEARLSGCRLQGVPEELAHAYADLHDLNHALDIALLAESCSTPPEEIAKLYFSMYETLDMPALIAAASSVPCRNATESNAMVGVAAQLENAFARLVQRVGAGLTRFTGETGERIAAALSSHQTARLQSLVSELRRGTPPNLAMLVVASQALYAIAGA